MIEVTKYWLSPTALVPNSPWPLLHYKNVLNKGDDSEACVPIEAWDRFTGNGWEVQWLYRYGQTQDSHFHSGVHECMAVLSGTATIRFGAGDKSEDLDANTTGSAFEAGGVEIEANAGDVFVIPAGVAHKTHNTRPESAFRLLSPGCGRGVEAENPRQALVGLPLTGFTMIGAYPQGSEWDALRGGGDFEAVWRVPKPERDPVFGEAEVEVDVAIIGGGASGSYAAVRLREDFNKTVLVIEKAGKLPAAGRPIDYGVEAYLNRETTIAFFKRFNVGLIDPTLASDIELLLLTKNVDFSTGLPVDVSYGPVDLVGVPVAFLEYTSYAVKYQAWFANGYFQTGDVPDDLLLSFGDFLAKYDLGGSLGILRNLLWLSDALNMPTWFVMSVVGLPQIQAFGLGLIGPSFKWPATYSAETLYERVLDLLGDDVLLGSTVVSSQRSDSGVELTVQTPSGQKTVKAKKLLVAAPPSPNNVGSWDLDDNEALLFGKFSWETLFVGVVQDTGFPSHATGIRNAPNDPSRYYLPHGSFTDAFSKADTGTGADLWTTRVLGVAGLSASEAQTMIYQSLTQMGEAGTYDIASPSLVAFTDHGANAPKVSAADLKDGFYNKLYALQGQRSTYWTGFAWAPDYSSILWDFTETLFPGIISGI
ncbi:FAD-dependent pyridine nucleotide-disulfide oxidoreductase [Grosmannia clavigera kw1407]|uniref:FAD-dependent pyridine nucleotide-disulfide oxidoreductase n=1 Tax=Grosmannia clavigera (strain kw1407 / UAMH 11150) TaxID=655863 RepID=F0XDM1_GROCL|nr:FAD-dependent pyridine nucleotide-disulfide oxidoreductase [Grosmannia clavigera kw1407]EFX04245.1 FAD-dependent pyridine nucleotide-disulfide oxidoreductase [Grosmannia clavigera kw1407]